MKYWTYLIYLILWESLMWGGGFYVVFILGHSAWWFALAVAGSAAAYSPNTWMQLGD
jgi:hypothetical protein